MVVGGGGSGVTIVSVELVVVVGGTGADTDGCVVVVVVGFSDDVPAVNGRLMREDSFDAAFAFDGWAAAGTTVVALILTFGVVPAGSVVGVAEPGTTVSPSASVLVVADAVSCPDDLPTKRMALSPTMMTAPATMTDHRQKVSSSRLGPASTPSPIRPYPTNGGTARGTSTIVITVGGETAPKSANSASPGRWLPGGSPGSRFGCCSARTTKADIHEGVVFLRADAVFRAVGREESGLDLLRMGVVRHDRGEPDLESDSEGFVLLVRQLSGPTGQPSLRSSGGSNNPWTGSVEVGCVDEQGRPGPDDDWSSSRD